VSGPNIRTGPDVEKHCRVRSSARFCVLAHRNISQLHIVHRSHDACASSLRPVTGRTDETHCRVRHPPSVVGHRRMDCSGRAGSGHRGSAGRSVIQGHVQPPEHRDGHRDRSAEELWSVRSERRHRRGRSQDQEQCCVHRRPARAGAGFEQGVHLGELRLGDRHTVAVDQLHEPRRGRPWQPKAAEHGSRVGHRAGQRFMAEQPLRPCDLQERLQRPEDAT
jgi:hypothetical protein